MKYSIITKIDDSTLDKCGIYRLTSPSGKVYIGSTTTSFRRRFYCHWNDNSSMPLKRAFKKYGREAFKYEVLEIMDRDSKDMMLDLETYYINLYDATHSSKGYNALDIAGASPVTKTPVMMFGLEGNHLHTYDSIYEACLAQGTRNCGIILSCKTATNKYHNTTNKKHRWVYVSDYNKGIRPGTSNKKHSGWSKYKVLQKDKAGNPLRVWDSLNQVAETLQLDMSNIVKCINGKMSTHAGYRWEKLL